VINVLRSRRLEFFFEKKTEGGKEKNKRHSDKMPSSETRYQNHQIP
jgi:hypothetical protein